MVTLRIIEAVLFTRGIEMRPGGFKVRWIALRILMEVHGVNSGRQPLQIELHFDSRSLLGNCRGPDGVALGIR